MYSGADWLVLLLYQRDGTQGAPQDVESVVNAVNVQSVESSSGNQEILPNTGYTSQGSQMCSGRYAGFDFTGPVEFLLAQSHTEL